jgi:hypothetical protein
MDQIPVDEFHGQGGSYVMDPETGKRTLVARTAESGAPAEQPAPDQDQPGEAAPAMPSGKRRKE